MSKYFNLLLLHRLTDIHPRSWVCLGGNKINELVYDLEQAILNEKNITRESLSHVIADKLSCHFVVIKRLLQGKTKFYPIPVLLELANLTKDGKRILNEIRRNMEYLKVNSASSKPIKAPKRLSVDLCKIIGAFMADGSLSNQVIVSSKSNEQLNFIQAKLRKRKIKYSIGYSKSRKEFYISMMTNYQNFQKIEELICYFKEKKFNIQTHYNIELTDEHKDSVEAFISWIKNMFNISPNNFYKKDNAWRCIFSNKILARYLISYFNIRPGSKVDIAFEPGIIKNSNIKFRHAFALGVLTFDGSSTIAGNISFEAKSKNLFNSISNILTKSNVKFGTRVTKETYGITTYKNNDSLKLNELFEKNTVKWLRFKESYTEVEESDFESRYKKFAQNKITFSALIRILNQVKTCDVNFLTKCFSCNHSSIVHYLNVLKNNGKIRISSNLTNFNFEFVSPTTTIYLKTEFHNKIFNLIKERFIEYQKFGMYVDIDHSTISAWKVRKNRIPLPIVKKTCDILGIDSSEINRNIEETDRKIIGII